MNQQLIVELAKLVIVGGPKMFAAIKAFRSGDESAPTMEEIAAAVTILKRDPESYFGPRLVDEGAPV